jgi:TonB family protein
MKTKRALGLLLGSLLLLSSFGLCAPVLARQGNQQDTVQPTRIKLGGQVVAAKLVSQPQPEYPPLARETRIEGNVILHVIIGVDGAVKEVAVESGHPLLVQSALDAVRQWHYRPTLLNGKPAEVDTTVTVTFKLAPSASLSEPSAEPAATLKREQDALNAVDPDTAADIRRLMEVVGTKNIMPQMFESQMQPVREQLLTSLKNLPADIDKEKIADRFIDMMKERVASGELSDLAIPVYAKYFTHDEIKDMLAFYESPTGKRSTEEAPSVIRDVQAAASQHWTNVVIPQLVRQMAAEFPELSKPKN